MINSPSPPAASGSEHDSVDAIVRAGPRGALAVAGLATATAPPGPERTMASTASSSEAEGCGEDELIMARPLAISDHALDRFAEFCAVFGVPRFTQFNALNASMRN